MGNKAAAFEYKQGAALLTIDFSPCKEHLTPIYTAPSNEHFKLRELLQFCITSVKCVNNLDHVNVTIENFPDFQHHLSSYFSCKNFEPLFSLSSSSSVGINSSIFVAVPLFLRFQSNFLFLIFSLKFDLLEFEYQDMFEPSSPYDNAQIPRYKREDYKFIYPNARFKLVKNPQISIETFKKLLHTVAATRDFYHDKLVHSIKTTPIDINNNNNSNNSGESLFELKLKDSPGFDSEPIPISYQLLGYDFTSLALDQSFIEVLSSAVKLRFELSSNTVYALFYRISENEFVSLCNKIQYNYTHELFKNEDTFKINRVTFRCTVNQATEQVKAYMLTSFESKSSGCIFQYCGKTFHFPFHLTSYSMLTRGFNMRIKQSMFLQTHNIYTTQSKAPFETFKEAVKQLRIVRTASIQQFIEHLYCQMKTIKLSEQLLLEVEGIVHGEQSAHVFKQVLQVPFTVTSGTITLLLNYSNGNGTLTLKVENNEKTSTQAFCIPVIISLASEFHLELYKMQRKQQFTTVDLIFLK